MIAAMTFTEIVAALGLVAGALVAIFTLLEKITGIGQRWLAKGVKSGVETLTQDFEEVKKTVDSVKGSLDEVQHLQRYHLGENGGAPRMHERVAIMENTLKEIRGEQETLRREHPFPENPDKEQHGSS